MASRTEQKQQARERRLAEERARAEKAQRQRRLQMIVGVVVVAVVVVVVAIVISSGGSSPTNHAPKNNSAAAKADATAVNSLIAGIPQAGNRLGTPSAPVTVTEYGDLQCPVCRDFAEGSEQQLIKNVIRPGKAQLVYRSLCTATCNGGETSVFAPQQAAAIAAGLQGKEWNYVLLFYKEQGQEGTGYVNDAYLNNLAGQVPGLNYNKWSSDRQSAGLTSQVQSDEQQAQSRGFSSTPTVVIQGPKGQAQPIVGVPTYSSLQSAIKSVS
jgi:protein-disulfide isomerase